MFSPNIIDFAIVKKRRYNVIWDAFLEVKNHDVGQRKLKILMKIYHLLLPILLLLMGCSQDDPLPELIEEEETTEVNLPPNNFNIQIDAFSHEGATLSWDEAQDPENETVTYSIFLNQTLLVAGLSDLTYEITNLTDQTNYSGEIVAQDSNNNQTKATFSFQTEKYYLKYLKKYDYATLGNSSQLNLIGRPSSMIKTDDGYIIAGRSSKPDKSNFHLFVFKIDYEGNLIWKQFYDYNLDDAWKCQIIQTASGFILIGHHHVLNLDEDGNTIWYKRIESFDVADGSAEIQSVKQDSKGNIFLVGGRGSGFNYPSQVGVLTKLNSAGDILWEKIFDASYRNFFNDLIIDDQDRLIVLGSTETSGITQEKLELLGSMAEQIDFWVLKLSNEGDIIWQNSFGDAKYDFPHQIISTIDNNLLVVGYGTSLFKLDELGNLIWSKSETSGSNQAYSIAETNDGGFVTTGSINYNTLVFSKYDHDGDLEWEKFVKEFSKYLTGCAIFSEADGGFRIAGSLSQNYYYGDEKPYLLMFKTDPFGNYED